MKSQGHDGRARILIVEDDEDSLEALSQLLNYEGISNVGVHNGQEALSYLYSHPAPDVILLDLLMPVMSGREFRHVQMSDARLSKIPTIALTAAQEGDVQELEGINTFIPKPVDMDTILNAVRPYCGGI